MLDLDSSGGHEHDRSGTITLLLTQQPEQLQNTSTLDLSFSDPSDQKWIHVALILAKILYSYQFLKQKKTLQLKFPSIFYWVLSGLCLKSSLLETVIMQAAKRLHSF